MKSKKKKPKTDGGSQMAENTEAIIVNGTVVEGKLSGDAPVRIEGLVSGNIEIDNTLVIAPEGRTDAEIYAEKVCIEGRHTGNIRAKELIQIAPSGVVKGDIQAPEISLEKGGVFSGNIDMTGSE